MDTKKILFELKDEEEQLLNEISELQKKINDVDPEKMNGQLLDSIKDTAIESITNALGVSDILESQINPNNITYNVLDMDKEYKSFQNFQKSPGNIGKDYTPKFVPKEKFNNLLELETKNWNRDNVTGNYFTDRKRQMRNENPDGYTSSYTGKHLEHGEKYDYEHVISASDAARNPVNKMYLSEDVMREELINSKENLVVVERNINQSKNNVKSEDIDEWIDGKYNKDHSKTREEGYELDRDKIHKTIDKAEEKRKEVLLKYGSDKKINKDAVIKAGKTAVGNSVKAGAKAAIGKLLSITIIELIEEFKTDSDNTLGEKIKNVIKRIKERAKEVLETFKEFSINGFISTLLESILKALLKTAGNLLKFIKTAFMSILKAVKVLFSSDYSWEEKKKEALKILGVTVATLIGLALEEAIHSAIVTAFPPLATVAGFISPVISGLIVGIGSVLILKGFQEYQNTIEFRKLNSEQGDKYNKVAKINLVQAGVSDIEATKSIDVSFEIFKSSVSIIESCKSSVQESFDEIKRYKDSTVEVLKKSKASQSDNDELLNQLLSL